MLANGAKLYYGTEPTTTGGDITWTELTGLKEIPDLGVDPEKVENTCLTDSIKHYEMGIGDPGDMEYVFKYVNDAATSPYRVLRGFEAEHKDVMWKEETFDGTTTEFTGTCSVKRNGGGVNSAIDFTLGIALSSDLTITDPA